MAQEPANTGRILQVLAHAAAAGYSSELVACGYSTQAAFTDDPLWFGLARFKSGVHSPPPPAPAPFSFGSFSFGPPAPKRRVRGPLAAAAQLGRLPRLHWLLEHGADPNVQMEGGRAPLHWACEEGHEELALRLLDRGSDPKARDDEDFTPLHRACEYERCLHTVVARLLELGADANARDRHKHTPLHRAALMGHDPLAARLLEAGADPRAASVGRETPLHLSCMHGTEGDAVSMRLMAAGAHPGARDGAGQTPMLWAVIKGCDSVIARMLECGVDVNELDSCRQTYLHHACDREQVAVALRLAAVSEYPDAKDEWGMTPLAMARKRKGMEAVIERLLERGVDASGQGKGSPQPPFGRGGGRGGGGGRGLNAILDVAIGQYEERYSRGLAGGLW